MNLNILKIILYSDNFWNVILYLILQEIQLDELLTHEVLVKDIDKAFEKLGEEFKQLELLSLHGLLGITDKFVNTLNNNKHIKNTLTTLDIHGCVNAIERSEEYLLSLFPKLVCFKYHF